MNRNYLFNSTKLSQTCLKKNNQKQPSFQANGLLPSTVFGTNSWRSNLALLGSSLHPWMFGGYDQGAEAPETFEIVEIERRNKKMC